MKNAIINAIHYIALAHGCTHETNNLPKENGNNAKTVTRYSLRKLTVTEDSDEITVTIRTQFTGLKRLFETTDDPVVRKILFDSIRVCTHCISDKCTSLLMAPARTLNLNGENKKSCSMWGQTVKMNVSHGNINTCLKIMDYYLDEAETAEEKHADVRCNEIKYSLANKNEFYIAGYCHNRTAISAPDEEAVQALLPKMPGLCAAFGAPDGNYAGAVTNFVNGSQYDFIFGVMLDEKPGAEKLPEGAVLQKINAGEWAVYNSSLSDYKSIWRHYTDKFYKLEKKGWDAARVPFELYDKNGTWRDVHIPVDADAPEEAGKTAVWEYRPDFTVAGWERAGEEDHPDWFDNTSIEKRLREILKKPGTVNFGYSLHQYYGKPMRFSSFVIADDTLEIPEDFMRRTIKGGLWRINSNRHFNGGAEIWEMKEPRKLPFEKQKLCLDHPRVFATCSYKARGGYDETWIPFRMQGKYVFETVELPPLKVFAKTEDPLNGRTVPDEELRTYYSLRGNANPGTLIVGYKPAFFNNKIMLYAEPLIKGVIAGETVPDGFETYTLEGGRFVKITEVNPDGSLYLRGEPGWDAEFINFPDKEAPEIKGNTDFSRTFRMLQTGYGKYYELYVPLKD